MARIKDELLASVFYLYPSRGDAEAGKPVGGSGFFVGMLSEATGRTHMYAVTNKHNISICRESVAIRAPTKDRELLILEREPDDWHPAPAHDISVLPIDLDTATRFESIDIDLLSSKADIEEYGIGPGEEVFMIGRFSAHDGGKKNLPSVRFGNISAQVANMAHRHYGRQESFAVEMRSISGYSGSPVFVYWNGRSDAGGGKNRNMFSSYLGVLGIDWGHINHHESVRTKYGLEHPEKLYVKSHSAMSGVVPAWHLSEFLDGARFREQRATDDRLFLEEEASLPSSVVADAIEGSDTTTQVEQDGADSEWRDPAETARLRDEMLRRTLNTPPKPRRKS
jgi:hypothetical protein